MSYSYDDVYILHAWRDNRRRLVLTQGEGYNGAITDNDVIKAPRFQLRDERDVIEIPSSGNPSVQLAVTRSNHTEDLLTCSIEDRENGIISCPITKSLTDITGEVKGEIRLITANAVIKFYGVDFYIFEGVSDDAATQSTQFSALISALQKVAVVVPDGSNTVTMDGVIQEHGTNPVASGVIYDALNTKMDKLSAGGSDGVFVESYGQGVRRTTYKPASSSSDISSSATNKLVTGAIANAALANKVDNSTFSQYQSTVYTKSEVNNKIYELIDSVLSGDDNAPTLLIDNDNEQTHYVLYYVDSDDTRHDLFDFSQYFAEKATTLAGYGITDAYIKTQVDAFINDLKKRIAATDTGKDIAQGSVGLSKLDFITIGDNLFDMNGKHTPDSYIDSSGNITSNDTYYVSEYIKVEPSTLYYVHGYSSPNYDKLRCVAEYDSDLNFIARNIDVTESMTTNSGTAYVRIAFPPARAYMTYFGKAQYHGQKFSAVIPSEVLDLSAIQSQIDSTKDKLVAESVPLVVLEEPDGFSWKTSQLHGKIMTDNNGTYHVDYDVVVNKNDLGTVAYVSPNGSDSNAGTINAPLANISTAYNNGANTIYLMSGIYKRTQTLYGVEINRNINIIGLSDDVIIAPAVSNISFTSHSNNVWSGSASFLSNIVDITNKTADGHYIKYEAKTTAADVQATEGSWAIVSGVLYVHTIGDVEPTTANGILLLHSGQSTPTPMFKLTGGNLYLENLTVIEGASPLHAQKQENGSIVRVYGKNCKFFYSRSTNNDVVMLQGISLSVFQNCEASFGLKDGFNYHEEQGIIPKAIEINCIGIGNGNVEDGNDQGSTIHDGGKIIRVKDICAHNYGANFADQGSDTESWNIGCVGYESYCTASVSQNTNYLAYTGTKMFLDGCIGFGSRTNTYTSAGDSNSSAGKIYFRNSFESYTKTESDAMFGLRTSTAFNINGIPLKRSSASTFSSDNVFTADDIVSRVSVLYIAANVTQINSGAFTVCTNLSKVYIDNEANAITIADGAFPSGVTVNYKGTFNTVNTLVQAVENINKNTYTKSEVNALIATTEYGGTWLDVQKAVRKGVAPSRYPVGYEFTVSKGNENIVFVVRGYDTITTSDSGSTGYTMILETKKIYDSIQLDAPEAGFTPPENALFYCVNTQMGQANYWFTTNDTSYYFSIGGGAVPVGAIIVVDVANMIVAVYQSAESTTPITGYGEITLSVGSSGAPLSSYCNLIDRSRLVSGSNNYAQSAVRQYLNSNATAGSVWSPTHTSDVSPSWVVTKDGFMKDLDSAFLNVVANANVICRTNNVYETGDYTADGNNYTLQDKFFILSRSELIAVNVDGTQLEYYNKINKPDNPATGQGQINNPAKFVKYNSQNTPVAYALRSSVLNSATSIYYIKADGTISNGFPKNTFGICPACIIA